MSTRCVCEKCGSGFELTEAEEEHKSRGIDPPALCPACREESRESANKARAAKRKRERLRNTAYVLGAVLFLVLIAVIYGAVNYENPYSPVAKYLSSSSETSSAAQTE